MMSEIFYRGDSFFATVQSLYGPRISDNELAPEMVVLVHRRDRPARDWPRYFNLGTLQVDRGAPREVLRHELSTDSDGWVEWITLVVSGAVATLHATHPSWVSPWCRDQTRCAWARGPKSEQRQGLVRAA